MHIVVPGIELFFIFGRAINANRPDNRLIAHFSVSDVKVALANNKSNGNSGKRIRRPLPI
jgi:hypothetical protein